MLRLLRLFNEFSFSVECYVRHPMMSALHHWGIFLTYLQLTNEECRVTFTINTTNRRVQDKFQSHFVQRSLNRVIENQLLMTFAIVCVMHTAYTSHVNLLMFTFMCNFMYFTQSWSHNMKTIWFGYVDYNVNMTEIKRLRGLFVCFSIVKKFFFWCSLWRKLFIFLFQFSPHDKHFSPWSIIEINRKFFLHLLKCWNTNSNTCYSFVCCFVFIWSANFFIVAN